MEKFKPLILNTYNIDSTIITVYKYFYIEFFSSSISFTDILGR